MPFSISIIEISGVLIMWQLISRVLMGWSLGSNEAANIFGLAVSTSLIVDPPGF